MNETLEYLQMFARFPFALRRFLKHTLTLEEARCIVRERMEHREENFLHLVERSIYGYPRSPYLALLKMAGCEIGDLRTLVKQKGLEGALHELREEGVYVTFEEFKGRKPILRHGKTIPIHPADFNNPSSKTPFVAETGGSTGAANQIPQDQSHSISRAPHSLITRAAYGILDTPEVMWRGIIPDTALSTIIQRAYLKSPPVRWFSAVGWHDSKNWLQYDMATYYIILWLWIFGARVPLPEFVRVDQSIRVARAVWEILKSTGSCALLTQVSAAVRVSLAAQQAGFDLRGLTILGGGEPSTPAKVHEIEKSGARYFSNYSLTEAKVIGNSCAHAEDKSDVHLFEDAHALITWPHQVEQVGVTVPAFHLTGLLDTATKILLNLEVDDYGHVEKRSCGCEFEKCGYLTHLSQIRSYSKLVGEGVTLIGSEMVRVLEQVLPERFGGSALDYQLVEEEDSGSFTRLSLIIHPRVDIASEQDVVDCLLNELRNSSPMADAARALWQQANSIQIKRQEPIWTARGKLMPLHITRTH